MRRFVVALAGVALGWVGLTAPAPAAELVDTWGQCVAHGWTEPSQPSEYGDRVGPYLLNGQGDYAGPIRADVVSGGASRFDAATTCVK